MFRGRSAPSLLFAIPLLLSCASRDYENICSVYRPDRFREYRCILGTNLPGSALDGGAGNDTLIGGPGDEILIGRPDNDQITGGPGIDLAAFSGTRAAYRIVRDGDRIMVTGPDGADTLMSVEVLRFDDVTLNLFAVLSRPQTQMSEPLDSIPLWRPPIYR
jgi:hypothetical protein